MAAAEANGVAPRTPVHFWIVAVLTLLWNLMGAFDYLATKLQLEFYMSQFTPEQLEYFYGFPAWMTVFWAFGVWGALAGSVGLLMRKKWAVWAFSLSIFGLFVSTIYSYFLSNGMEIMGSAAVFMNILIWAIALFLLFYSCAMAKKGVLS